MKKTDCIFFDDCHLPTRFCNDDCGRYDTEGKHPFEDDGDRGDYLYEMEKDRRMMEGE
jgi:hypothetical protein